ncbi:MAG: DUF2202 domain-containing protein [Spirochaetales bacterium]|nr:DUF2202 domain-containing protein [Spirochaetales bacterium]
MKKIIIILAILLATVSTVYARGTQEERGYGEGNGRGNGQRLHDGSGRGNGQGKNRGGAFYDENFVKDFEIVYGIKPGSGTLSEKEKENLIFMAEEEKLARDVYLGLYDKWNLPVFKNIANSEQMHMDAVTFLLDA